MKKNWSNELNGICIYVFNLNIKKESSEQIWGKSHLWEIQNIKVDLILLQ
jgi:hypothetical protein